MYKFFTELLEKIELKIAQKDYTNLEKYFK